MPSPIISTQQLTRRFAHTVAVDDLTLEVYPGEIFGFLGHNGAGKTTTVRMLNGVLASSAGSARVLGLDPLADGPALRRRTGVLTETPSLDERLTARDLLCIYADLFDVPKADVLQRVEELLALFELADRADEMVASVIAADSFAGEKERKTLEALLYSPTTDRELLAAKLISAWLPAIAVAWGSFLLYAIVANLASWPVMGQLFFPTTMWLVLAFWVAPAVAGLGLAAMVLVSIRAQGFQDAYQLGSLVVLPVVILMIGQAAGVMYFSTSLVLLLGLVVWIVDGLLLYYGRRLFQRAELIARL